MKSSLVSLIRCAHKMVDAIYDEESVHGTPLPQVMALAALATIGPMSQTRLCTTAYCDRSTLSEMLSRMEKSGLIEKHVSAADRRAMVVSITDSGREVHRMARGTLARVEKRIEDELSKTAFSALAPALAKISMIEARA